DKGNRARTEKWGAYRLDREDFEFARAGLTTDAQTLEAALMDWADDIAYSVHDLEDFHRVGAIPWAVILSDGAKSDIVQNTFNKWFDAPKNAKKTLENAFDRLFTSALSTVFGPLLLVSYEGGREQRFALRNLTSFLIGRFLQATKLTESGLSIDLTTQAEVRLLKQITKQFIISSPSLAAQQHGQKHIIKDVFDALFDHSGDTYPKFLPTKMRYMWVLSEGQKARFAADCIASMTESELIALHQRLTGAAAGSVLDPIVR
ncbi:deoxyguanosinetriphosphate triphosphohydrolase, partial [Rhizobiaceae sp. 2RAB30]